MGFRVLGESLDRRNNDIGSILSSQQYFNRIASYDPKNLIGYWPLWEKEIGLTAVAKDLSSRKNNGTYTLGGGSPDTNFIFGVEGIGDGKTAVRVDVADSNTSVGIGSVAFDADWNGDKLSMISWGRVTNPAYWGVDTTFRYTMHFRSQASDTYYFVMGKRSDANTLVWRRRSGGAIIEQTKVFAAGGPSTWFCQGMTFDIAANPQISFYLWDTVDGFQVLNERNNAALTAWGANPVTNPIKTLLLAGSSTLQEWIGAGAHMAIWADVKIPTNNMRRLMSLNN